MRKLLAVSLSLANLCYLRVWAELLALRPEDLFYRSHPPRPFQYLAAMCGVSLLAGLFVVVTLTLRNAPGWLRSVWLIVLMVMTANAIRATLAPHVSILRSGLFRLVSPTVTLGLALASFALVCYVVLRFSAAIARAGAFIATVLAPVTLVTFGGSLLQMIRNAPEDAADQAAAARFSTAPDRRVVWVIFDELDYRLSFVARPKSIQMPNFDWFAAHSFYAMNALPPSNATDVSMPAFIHGREVRGSQPVSANRLELRLWDGGALIFGKTPNLFSKAHSSGFNTAVVGWYLPYCRTLSDSLSDCWWRPMETQENSAGDTFAQAVVRQPRSLLETPFFSLFGQSLVTRAHASAFTGLLDHARKSADDPALGLVLIHLNIPHPTFFYVPQTGKFDRANTVQGYNDTLALVDRTLGELRNAMVHSGVWDNTTMLVSADHWFRTSAEVNGKRDHRVPFLLHLAKDDNGLAFEHEFNTVLTADLILATLSGELRTNTDAANWIARNAPRWSTSRVDSLP